MLFLHSFGSSKSTERRSESPTATTRVKGQRLVFDRLSAKTYTLRGDDSSSMGASRTGKTATGRPKSSSADSGGKGLSRSTSNDRIRRPVVGNRGAVSSGYVFALLFYV